MAFSLYPQCMHYDKLDFRWFFKSSCLFDNLVVILVLSWEEMNPASHLELEPIAHL